MPIRISCIDTVTEEVLETFVVSDTDIKALGTDMIPHKGAKVVFIDWLNNAIHNKGRQCIDRVCEEALNDKTGTILTTKDKQDIVSGLAAEGSIITSVKGLPINIKRQIVAAARVKSAAERQAEMEV